MLMLLKIMVQLCMISLDLIVANYSNDGREFFKSINKWVGRILLQTSVSKAAMFGAAEEYRKTEQSFYMAIS